MKNLTAYGRTGLLLLAFALAACDSALNQISFPTAFPKPHRDLAAHLGKEFYLQSNGHTLHLQIQSTPNLTVITEKASGDTLFRGQVARYRGLYFLSQQLKNGRFALSAVKIRDNQVYGLTQRLEQQYLARQIIGQSGFPNLVEAVSADSSQILLRMDKKAVKQLFTQVLAQLPPDTLIVKESHKSAHPAITVQTTDPEELAFGTRVYPNPVRDLVYLEFPDKSALEYEVRSLAGKVTKQGILSDKLNAVDLSSLTKGLYLLRIVDSKTQESEVFKLIKQ